MNCGFCGTELENDARFCHICGQPVPVDRSEGGFCPHCDVRLPAVAVFCPHCGARLGYSRLRESLPAQEAAPNPPAVLSRETEKADAPAQDAPKSAPSQEAAAPREKKTETGKAKTKKSSASNRGGRLLALLIIILIFASLGAVLYVEANTRGLGVGEYASVLLPVGETEKPARWSDLKAEQGEAPTAAVQEPEEQGPTEQELRTQQAYRLYCELLESRRDRIEEYNWQLENEESRPVVLCDVCGDELPELIWVEAAPAENVQAATLYVAALRNGAAELVYSDQWDVQAGGGFCYYLFQQQGEKALHSYAAWGEENWTECYAVLSEQDGVLVRSEQLKSELSAVWDGDGVHESKRFLRLGEQVTEEQWRAAVEELCGQTSSVLMCNRFAGSFARNWTEQNGCPAMTLREALAVLSESGGSVLSRQRRN